MAGSRLFGATDDLEFRASGTAAPTDAFSLAIVVKPTGVSGLQTLIESRASEDDTIIFCLDDAAPALLCTEISDLIAADSGVVATSGEWQLLGVSKPAGERQLRFHRVKLSDGTPTHDAGYNSPPDVPDVPIGPYGIANYRGDADDDDENTLLGRVAAAGVWNRALTDAEFASMTTWAGMMHTAPRALWRLDGSPTFVDETGRNNDQDGTTTSTHDADGPSDFWPVDTTGRSYGGYGSGNWPSSSWSPYSPGGVWTAPIDTAIDVVHPNSAALVATALAASGSPSQPVGNLVAGTADTTRDYAHPLYFARADDPEFTIDFAYDPAWGSHPLQGTRLRIPDAARAAGGNDAHLAVVQPPDANGQCWEYDLWEVTAKPAGGGTLRCGWGGRLRVEGSGIGAAGTASHFGLVAGAIRGAELAAGAIDHALFVTVKYGARDDDVSFGYGAKRGSGADGSSVYPAELGDSEAPTTPTRVDDAPPMGARFWLDMTEIEINGLTRVPAWKKTILKAMARYGAFFGDTGGPGFGFQFESGQAYTSFGVADPIVSFAADNGVTNYFDSSPGNTDRLDVFVFDMSSDLEWTRKLRVVVPPSYPVIVTGDAPVSWWRLGESTGTSAADERGANGGTYVSGTTLGATSLLPSQTRSTAVTFDGRAGNVRVTAARSLDLTTAITLEAWIKPAALAGTGTYASVLTKPDAYTLQFDGSLLEFTITQSGARKRLKAAARMSTATVYHVVGTFDGVTQRLYVNGALVSSTALAGSADVSAGALRIGSWDGTGEFFNGTIDEAAIYRSVLSAEAVARHYASGTVL